jgi:hypothetical protein
MLSPPRRRIIDAGSEANKQEEQIMAAQPALERDAVKLDSKHYKVELENERVRVVRIRYGGREKSVMHQHPPGIGLFLTDANFKFRYPDGKSENISVKAGEYLWFGEVWEHDPENLSDNNAEVIYVELK